MSIETLMIVAGAILAGSFISIQGPINAQLAAKVGHPLVAATISFIAGTLALIVVAAFVARDQANFSVIPTLAPYLLVGGGLLGAMYVTSNIVLTPQIGIAAVIALGIAGQMVASLLLDHYGAMGLVARELSVGRMAGAFLVLAGALMVRFL